jgi:sugar O-acyltransferase (sialic acid O-acetyltransferase NeuD family)
VADLISVLGHETVGFADADEGKLGTAVGRSGATVLLTESTLVSCVRGEAAWPVDVEAIALGMGDNASRKRLLAVLDDKMMPPLVHPRTAIGTGVTIGAGSVVLAGAVINVGASIGRGVIVNSGAIVEHDCVLADAVHASPGAILCGTVSVGTCSWVAAGAVIIPGRAIGDHCVVGAGAIVIDDVADGTTVVGNPARPMLARPSQPLRRIRLPSA